MITLTDTQKAQFIVAKRVKNAPCMTQAQVVSSFKAATGLSRAVFYDLIAGKPLKNARKKLALDEAFQKVCAQMGDCAYQDWIKRAYDAVPKDIDREFGPTALTYSIMAMDEQQPAATRLLMGIPAQKIFWDWLRRKSNAPEPQYFKVSDEDLRAKGLLLAETLQKIIAEHPEAPDGLFPEVGKNPALLDTSYRVLRCRFASDFLGWNYMMAESIPKRVELLQSAYQEGKGKISADLQWMAEMDPEEIAWRYNPFILASHAGDWSEAARLAGKLFAKNRGILTKRKFGIEALVDDHDAWPGLAAVLANDCNEDLGDLRIELKAFLEGQPELSAALECARDAIHDNQGYFEVFNLCTKGGQ